MITQNQYSQIRDYIDTDEVRNLFSDMHSHKNKSRETTAKQYRRNDSILSLICNTQAFNLLTLFSSFDDRHAVGIIKKATYSGTIPLKFRMIEAATLFLALMPLAIMFFDLLLSLTSLSVLFYLYVCICGVSLYVTARIAKKEWVVHNWNEDR